MSDIVKAVLEFIGNKLWIILTIFFLTLLAICIFTFYSPIVLKISTCTIRDETYVLHEFTHRVKSIVETGGGISINLCTVERVKTLKNNLVEK